MEKISILLASLFSANLEIENFPRISNQIFVYFLLSSKALVSPIFGAKTIPGGTTLDNSVIQMKRFERILILLCKKRMFRESFLIRHSCVLDSRASGSTKAQNLENRMSPIVPVLFRVWE